MTAPNFDHLQESFSTNFQTIGESSQINIGEGFQTSFDGNAFNLNINSLLEMALQQLDQAKQMGTISEEDYQNARQKILSKRGQP